MARKDVSAVVSGLGLGCGFITALDKARRECGVNDDDFHAAIAEESPLIPKFADMIAESCKPKLLEPIRTVCVFATTERFVAKERFVLGTGSDAAVKISYLGDGYFKDRFLKKIEKPFAGSVLRAFRLRESSLDQPIITELGGEAKAETTLTEISALISMQPNGEEGVLLANGGANIFYVKDKDGVLRAVDVYWRDDGWGVDAFALDGFHWRDGRQVFSRNS